MLDPLFSFTYPIMDTDESGMFSFLVKMMEEYFDVVERSDMDRAESLPEGVPLKAGMPFN